MPVSKFILALLCAAVLPVLPAAAGAQERDPDADSPSGQVYAIPLDTARGDAAPRGGKGSGGGSSTSSGGDVSSGTDGGITGEGDVSGDGEASGLTSGSGGGSGSSGGSGSGGSGSGEGGGSGSGGDTPETSAIRSENGFGSSSRVPGLDGTPTVSLRAVSDPSGSRVYGLLLLGVLIAAGVGLASRSARRTH